MSDYLPMTTFERPKTAVLDRAGNVTGEKTNNRAPMQQKPGTGRTGLDAIRANGPGRYMGGNYDSAVAESAKQTAAAKGPTPEANKVAYDTAGIGFQHYHDMLANKSGGLDSASGSYTSGHFAGMNQAQAMAFAQKEWDRHGQQGTQKGLIERMSQFYGRSNPATAGSTAAEPPTAPSTGATQVGALRPPPGIAPPTTAQPSSTANMSNNVAAAPKIGLSPPPAARPITTNDNALAARLQGKAQYDPAGPHIIGSPAATRSPAAAPSQSLDTMAKGLTVLADAKTSLGIKPPSVSTSPGGTLTPPPTPVSVPATSPAPPMAKPINTSQADPSLGRPQLSVQNAINNPGPRIALPRPDVRPRAPEVSPLSPLDSRTVSDIAWRDTPAAQNASAVFNPTQWVQGRKSEIPPALRADTRTPDAYPEVNGNNVTNRMKADNKALKSLAEKGTLKNTSYKDPNSKGGAFHHQVSVVKPAPKIALSSPFASLDRRLSPTR